MASSCCVRRLHFMDEMVRTSSKCRGSIYRTWMKCHWSIYRTSRKRRGTLWVVHKVERNSPTVILQDTESQWVNSVPPYVRNLYFMYQVICTSSKYCWSIHRTSDKCHWSIYCTSRKCRGTLRVVYKAERSSPTVRMWSATMEDLLC